MNLDNIVNFGFVGMSYTGEGFDVTNVLWDSVSEYETLCDERGVPLKEGVSIKVKEGKDIAEYVYKTYGGAASGSWVKKQTRPVVNFGGVLGTSVLLTNSNMGTYCGEKSVMWSPDLSRFVIKYGSKYYAGASNSIEYFDQEGLPYEDSVYVSGGKVYVAKDGKLYEAAGGSSTGTIGNATTTKDGLMSADDKLKLDTLWNEGVVMAEDGDIVAPGTDGGGSLSLEQAKLINGMVNLGIDFVVE